MYGVASMLTISMVTQGKRKCKGKCKLWHLSTTQSSICRKYCTKIAELLHSIGVQQTEFLSHKTVKTAHANREVVCVCRKWVIGMVLTGLLMSHAAAAEDYIHWVDFDVPVEALVTAMTLDIESQGKEKPLN